MGGWGKGQWVVWEKGGFNFPCDQENEKATLHFSEWDVVAMSANDQSELTDSSICPFNEQKMCAFAASPREHQ